MKRWLQWLLAGAAALGLCPAAGAQHGDAPPLRVTARLQAPAEVQSGATVKLLLDVLTPTWFTQPPQLPALNLPGVLVTPPSGQGEILRENIDGVAFSGLRYTYVLSPTVPGTVQVPALTVSAQVGPGGKTASGGSQPLSLRVGGADTAMGAAGAAGMREAAGRMRVTQAYTQSSDPLVEGGRITRSITQRAEGTQAMLLPEAPLADVPGFRRYPLEPEVTTLTDGRGGFVGGQRTDRAEYVPLRAGALALPAVTVSWRDSATGAPRHAELPGREVRVQPAPAAAAPFSLAEDLARLRHGLRWVLPASWLAWAGAAILLLLALWLGWPWWRRGARALRGAAARRSARRRASESWHWRAWRREAHRPGAGLGAFYRWLRRARGVGSLREAVAALDAASRGAADAALRAGYGPASAPGPGPGPARPGGSWRAGLYTASRQWRHDWRGRGGRAAPYGLPPALNPPRRGAMPRAARPRSES